jgi:SCY1-like protein 1
MNLTEEYSQDDSSLVSVFEFDGTKRNLLPLAKNALRKLRTVRHPDVLKFLDVVETDTTVLIMTERVQPLSTALDAWRGKGVTEREDWLLWGLHRISVRGLLVPSDRRFDCRLSLQIAISFVNDTASSTHGNLCAHSVFISPSGEWKLGGFELLSSPKDDAAVLYVRSGFVVRTFEPIYISRLWVAFCPAALRMRLLK